MAHTASGLARRLARWGAQAAIVGLAACGGGSGGGDSSLSTTSDLQADALRQPRSACMAAPGFTAQDPFVVNSLGAGSLQLVRFAGPLEDGGFAVAWVSHTPADTQASRLQWQRFDATGRAAGPPVDLASAEDAGPPDVAVHVQPSGRSIVAFAVSRLVDPSNPFRVVNSVLARTFQDGTALPGEITIGSQTVDARSRPPFFHQPVLAVVDDGSFLGGWHLVGMVKPQLFVQQVTAGGTLVGDLVQIDSLGGLGPPREQLITLSGGGWIAATPFGTGTPGFQPYTLLTQVGVRHPLDTPDVFGVPGAFPAGSVLLQDARGLLVASGPSQPGGTTSLQQFNRGGHAAGRPDSLALTPIDAAALSTGEAALLADAGGTVTLQRIGSRGDPIGQPLATPAPADTLSSRGPVPGALAGAVPGGGLVLIWARNDADGSRVVAQLFTPSCSG